MFDRLRRRHGVRSYLAHNMTVTRANVIEEVVAVCRRLGYRMCSFQPAAYVGDDRRWQDGYDDLTDDRVWREVERGVGRPLPHRALQVGDPRCNRTTWGVWGGQVAGGLASTAPRHRDRPLLPVTYVMHRFMDADSVRRARELMARGVEATDASVRATQQRLRARLRDGPPPTTTGSCRPVSSTACSTRPRTNGCCNCCRGCAGVRPRRSGTRELDLPATGTRSVDPDEWRQDMVARTTLRITGFDVV